MLSNYLAEIFGISIVVISLALLLRDRYIKRIFSSVENEECMLFCGFVSFVIGIAIILAHNVWVKNWQVIVTILGWMSLLKGLAMLFMPELVKSYVKKVENKNWLPIALVVMVFVGLVITYFGFTA